MNDRRVYMKCIKVLCMNKKNSLCYNMLGRRVFCFLLFNKVIFLLRIMVIIYVKILFIVFNYYFI